MTKSSSFSVKDSFANLAARLGVGQNTDNISNQGSYDFNPITRNRQMLEWMYGGSWLVGTCINAVADDMVRAGIEVQTTDDPDDVDKLEASLHELAVWTKLNEGIKWGRLYGGAIAVMLIDGQDPATPLRLDTVGQGQFKGLAVADRWMVNPSLNDPIRTLGPDMGEPLFYDVVVDGGPLPRGRYHHTRVIRFEGIPQPYWRKIAEMGWGLSVIEPLYDRLLAFDSTTQGAAQLVYKAHLRTLKVEGLRQIVSAGGKAMEGLARQVDNMRLYQINEGITMVDAKDEFQVDTYTFTGLDDVLMQFGQQLSGAMQIPLVRLFGQSPAGLSATGESDMRNYYDGINAQQEARLRRPMTKLIEVMHRSVLGREPPPGFTFKFTPLWQLSDTDKATITSTFVTAIMAPFEAGAIDLPTALKELRNLAQTTGAFSSITDEAIEEAENAPPPIPEGMGMPGEEGFGGAAGPPSPEDDGPDDKGSGGKPSKPPFPVKDEAWSEGDHPRAENGQFGNGSGGGLSVAKGKTAGGISAAYDPSTKSYKAPGVDPARLKALAIPPAWKDVRISSDPDAPLQVLGLDAKGRPQYRYSEAHAQSQSAKKFARIGTLVAKRNALNDKTAKMAAQGNDTAAAVRLMLLTGMRPGGDGDTQAKEKAFGATTLQKSHVKVKGDVVSYAFVGKKGVKIEGSVKDPTLARFIDKRLQGPGDRLFETTASRANAVVKATVGGDYKCKDLRTLKANEMAASMVARMDPPKDPKAKAAAIKEVATKVSAQLGNTPAVALKDYINGMVFSKWEQVA